ncbi:MAG TPA: coniferyl aldehyde dehydrogenase [Gallionellaceae bacterium]
MTTMRQEVHGNAASERLAGLFAAQQQAYLAQPYPAADERIARLKALKQQIRRHQDVLVAAMQQDYGQRSAFESQMLDLACTIMQINHAIGRIRGWMKPQRRATEWLFATNRLSVTYQPKGVVGIIVPWNFPLYLGLGPLVAALSAGNRVILKMPELTPATNAALEHMLAEVFREDEVAVTGEELPDPAAFTALPFDHLIFTGSTATGRKVMRAAAENLTPVTLELGGKSPAVVSRDYPLAQAARSIVHGKGANCGQVCISPDYALVPRELEHAFVAAAQASFVAMYGNSIVGNPDYTWVVDNNHLLRLQVLLEDARTQGAEIIACADYDAARDGRQMPLHIVRHCTPAMRLLQEELFGPILPVVPYDTLDDAIAFINAGTRPLALYAYSHAQDEREALLRRTHSGGVTFNDWAWHVINHDVPFGGTGHSGMGSYHGVEGFRELSNAKPVFRRHRLFPSRLFQPPYGNWIQRMVVKLFLGKGDPRVNNKP